MGRTKRRAIQREKERRQRRQRITLIVVGVIAVVVALAVVLVTRPVEVNIAEDILTRYEGIPTSADDRGFPVLGNPDAPARLVEYSSFDCPSCRVFHDEVTKNIVDRVRSGEASFTYVPIFGTGSIPNGRQAAEAAVCAGEQGRFYEYHDLLFEWQGRFVASAFQPNRLRAGAEELGLDIEQFNACLNSEETAVILDNAQAAFRQSGGTGTPTLTINDELASTSLAAVNTQIDAIMTTADPVPLEPVDTESVVTEEATEEVVETEVVTEEAEETEAVTEEPAEATEPASDEDEVTPEPTAEAEATEEAIEEVSETEEATEES